MLARIVLKCCYGCGARTPRHSGPRFSCCAAVIRIDSLRAAVPSFLHFRAIGRQPFVFVGGRLSTCPSGGTSSPTSKLVWSLRVAPDRRLNRGPKLAVLIVREEWTEEPDPGGTKDVSRLIIWRVEAAKARSGLPARGHDPLATVRSALLSAPFALPP